MSRLYYDKPVKSASLTGAPEKTTSEYFEKVAKLIPSEIIGGYVALIGLVPLIKMQRLHSWFYGGVFLLCLILTPVYLNWMADKDKPKKVHLIVSTIAFIFWSYAISGGSIIPSFYDSAIASILLIGFSLISSKIRLA